MRVDLAYSVARPGSGVAQRTTGASETTLIAAIRKKIASALVRMDGGAA